MVGYDKTLTSEWEYIVGLCTLIHLLNMASRLK